MRCLNREIHTAITIVLVGLLGISIALCLFILTIGTFFAQELVINYMFQDSIKAFWLMIGIYSLARTVDIFNYLFPKC